ncbi:hypothetical protein FAZ15_21980 [Sphingobacterium olei]|uniref:DUF4468 domain-containing protein n=1 Tax=Sphingobacterium olei TaxID=2571155 RepID=A0A4U0N7Z0_9SPHI|nr:hypothetical protein [Sphingobacterium olei]TJZ49895.1 hypothetical protein FAZ15_21980 [Sphingobacterium olei]
MIRFIRFSMSLIGLLICQYGTAQTTTFIKDIQASNTTLIELTDASGQALKKGAFYRIKLSVRATGTRTGAEYLAWYNNLDSVWFIRMVSSAGQTSNHPLLVVENNLVKVKTNHSNMYTIRAFVETYDAANINSLPHLFGSSFQWQRNINNLSYTDGNVGIGTDSPSEKLAVNGNIRAKEIKVETANWPDYVFEKDHKLMSLDSLESFINKNGHLPEVPKAKEIEESGLSLGEMNKILMKKMEEMTLYIINLEERVKSLESNGITMENSGLK